MLVTQTFDNVFFIVILDQCYRTFSHPFFNNFCGAIEQALYVGVNVIIPMVSIIVGIALFQYAFQQGIVFANLQLIIFGGIISWLMTGTFWEIDILLFVCSILASLGHSNQAKIISWIIFVVALLVNLKKIIIGLSQIVK
jgi:hypothetical protein